MDPLFLVHCGLVSARWFGGGVLEDGLEKPIVSVEQELCLLIMHTIPFRSSDRFTLLLLTTVLHRIFLHGHPFLTCRRRNISIETIDR